MSSAAPLQEERENDASAALVETTLDDGRWFDLVTRAQDALPFHLPEWGELLGDCYGLRTSLLALESGDGSFAAGMPVVESRAPISRDRRWTSLPFTDYCPPLLSPGAGAAGLERLMGSTERVRVAQGVSRLELRAEVPAGSQRAVGFRHVLHLEPDRDAVRRRFKKRQVQQRLAKAEREGLLELRRAETAADVADVFYALHVSTRRRLGVPVQPRRFFRLVWERMLEPGHGWALLAYAGREPVAGAVFLSAGSTVVYKFGASERKWQHLRPNNLLLWGAIRESCERGFELFDFGRTDPWSTGLRDFKLGWGTVEEELRYTRLGSGWPAGEPEGPGTASELLGHVLRRSPAAVSRLAGALLYRYAA